MRRIVAVLVIVGLGGLANPRGAAACTCAVPETAAFGPDWAGLGGMGMVMAALTAAGVVGLRRRRASQSVK